MNPLTHLLDHPRAQGAFTLRMVMRPPWAVRIEDGAALTLCIVTSGSHELRSGAGAWALGPGDLALVRGPEPYLLGHEPDAGLTAIIGPGQACTTTEGVTLHQSLLHGVRLWGNDPAGPDAMTVATYESVGEVGRLVTDLLPPVAVLPAGSVDPTLTALLTSEIGSDAPAQGVVLDRLVDVLLIKAIRTWIDQNRADLPGWITGSRDDAVAKALSAIHDHPDHPWTISELAGLGMVSRATLAARFTEQVGDPPIAYLTRWRLALARDMLADDSLTLAAVARRVGYGSPFALSAAFKSRFGTSPSAYRAQLPSPLATPAG